MKLRAWHTILALTITLVYLLVSTRFIMDEKFIILLVPPVLLAFLFLFTRMDLALLLAYLLIPLSVPLREYFPSLPVDMYLPTEPLLVMLTLIFIMKSLQDKSWHRDLMLHPVSLAIYFSLFVIFISAVTSSMPAVSFKYLASRIWFVVPFYFMASLLFMDRKRIRQFMGLYAFGLSLVIVYTIQNHLGYGLNDQEASNWVCSPFFNDHTAYGAALAMILFGFVAYIRLPKANKYFLAVWPVIIFALIFSYSRAAWLSVAGAGIVLLLVWLRISFKWVALSTFLVVGAIGFFYNDIMFALERNDQDSSGDFRKHITSMVNITTDASNVERLNRWNSAFRMFRERPLTGWGPGTYMFQYAPFQFSREKTIISTNFGDGGNAHSEYLGPLAESGIFGPVYFILISVVSLITGFRVYRRAEEKEIRWLALFITLGLTSYLLHGFLNNFLDTDKLSALFWGYIAILVSLDLGLRPKAYKEH